jgi:hypothetical protein
MGLSVELHWTRDQPDAKAFAYSGQQRWKTRTNTHTLSGIRTHDLNFEAMKHRPTPQISRPLGTDLLYLIAFKYKEITVFYICYNKKIVYGK